VPVPLLNVPPQEWYCPNCPVTDVTAPLPPGQSRYHPCPGLHGLNAPLVRSGTRAAVIASEREDYLNGDVQATGDDGRVYMNVMVLREDGCDTTVFAPTAAVELGSAL
jgi:hypothetical protein